MHRGRYSSMSIGFRAARLLIQEGDRQTLGGWASLQVRDFAYWVCVVVDGSQYSVDQRGAIVGKYIRQVHKLLERKACFVVHNLENSHSER